MKTPASSRWALAAGAAYVLVYLVAATLLPRPASVPLRAALGHLFIFIPPALAAAATAHAARRSQGSEKAFWLLLAGASAGLAVAEILFALHEAALPAVGGVEAAAHLGYYACVILLTVALLVRPDRARGPGEVRSAVLEWGMAALGGYFLVVYFAILPRGDAPYPWLLVATLQEARPGLWALALLPFFPIAAAALGPRGAVWVRSRDSEAGDRRRARLAVIALAVPPLIDLACRAVGLQPALAAQRTDLTLACFSALSLLVALRVRQAARPARERLEPVETGGAHGEPSDYLEFASGVAHELNNPLMAVAGWAELARRRGAPEPRLQALGEATTAAAAAVARLQQLVRSGRTPGGPR